MTDVLIRVKPTPMMSKIVNTAMRKAKGIRDMGPLLFR